MQIVRHVFYTLVLPKNQVSQKIMMVLAVILLPFLFFLALCKQTNQLYASVSNFYDSSFALWWGTRISSTPHAKHIQNEIVWNIYGSVGKGLSTCMYVFTVQGYGIMLRLLFDNTCVNCENFLDKLKNTGCYFITVTRSRSKGMHLKRNSFS